MILIRASSPARRERRFSTVLARLDPAPSVALAHVGARAVVATRVAHAGVLVAALFLPLSSDVTQLAFLAAILALAAAHARGAPAYRRSPLDLPVALAVASTIAIGVALLAAAPAPSLESATRFRAFVAPLVVLSALSLPLPGDAPGAARDRAVRALLAWSLAALAASAVGIVQATAGLDLLHLAGLRQAERLPPVPGWPGHYAATGFFSGYSRYGPNLLPPLFLAAALALLGRLPSRQRVLLGVAAVACMAAVVFTSMRSGWASLAAGLAALAFLSGGRTLRRGLPLAAGGLGLAILHPGLGIRLSTFLAGDGNGDRRSIWRVCAAIYRDHPLGVGPGGFERFAQQYWPVMAPGTEVASGCHDVPFLLLLEGGPLLVLAYAAAAALVARPFWRVTRDRTADPVARAAAIGALAALAALAPSALFHDLHRHLGTTLSTGATLGLAGVLALPARPARGRRVRAGARAEASPYASAPRPRGTGAQPLSPPTPFQ